eukprot:scaffold3594_cov138-Cylindrotheca_fusiformis.AAC.4
MNQKEVISLLELCLWKMKIIDVGGDEQITKRESCRINSGASVVIPHVLPFLGNVKVKDYLNNFNS